MSVCSLVIYVLNHALIIGEFCKERHQLKTTLRTLVGENEVWLRYVHMYVHKYVYDFSYTLLNSQVQFFFVGQLKFSLMKNMENFWIEFHSVACNESLLKFFLLFWQIFIL